MYLLDTDTVSSLIRADENSKALRQKLRMVPLDELSVSIVTVAELAEGALALIRRQQVRNSEIIGYELLEAAMRQINRFAILRYDTAARDTYLAFPPAVKRMGRGDCQIGAIALCHNAVVVTRNLRHFEQIPGVVCEDWAA